MATQTFFTYILVGAVCGLIYCVALEALARASSARRQPRVWRRCHRCGWYYSNHGDVTPPSQRKLMAEEQHTLLCEGHGLCADCVRHTKP